MGCEPCGEGCEVYYGGAIRLSPIVNNNKNTIDYETEMLRILLHEEETQHRHGLVL